MSDDIKHECGVAMIRLLKPLNFYKKKYNTVRYALNKMYLLMQKQVNRGQDGAGQPPRDHPVVLRARLRGDRRQHGRAALPGALLLRGGVQRGGARPARRSEQVARAQGGREAGERETGFTRLRQVSAGGGDPRAL